MSHKLNIFTIVVLAAICFFTISNPVMAEGANKAISYRISDNENSSRFALDLAQKPDYKISIRHNPERVVIELKNTAWGDIKTQGSAKRITGVRHNLMPDNNLQIVLDIKTAFTIKKYFTLPPKENIHRLVIDIESGISQANTQKDAFIPIPKLKKIKKPLIAIDAGHGGRDPGTTGYHGSKEKILTLAYAYTIKEVLENTGRYEVILTRKDDTYIDLKKRVEIARDAKANMFLSIHADSHNNRMMSGFSVYTLSEKASDKQAEALAQKENAAGLLDNVDVTGDTSDVTALLIDLVQRETKNLSADFAENILQEVRPETEILHLNPHRFAGFRVLTAPDIPSALLELGYLSNKKEEKLLLSTNHKKRLAEAIVRAINNHFEKYPVE